MTDEQKANIIELRTKGLTYSDIAEKLQISVNTVKSFYRRYEKKTTVCCKFCRKHINQPYGTREKKFCSDICRMKWWKIHTNEINKKAVYDFKCENCGKGFQAYGNNHRKYCSRECYINMRFGGDKGEQ